ncbi:transglutaminase family protein [Luteitalea sp.]|uniref:transglutaminase-like domain-containing protein n=1 Tax=Luteitalea sp. TaxID=2004800 RepID=UPI0025C3D4FB|nr:transglutaminase family protein [Luteitalea sp.]
MQIRLGYDLRFDVPAPTVMTTLLHVHPSRVPDLIEPDVLQVDPAVSVESYLDLFGNRATRLQLPAGTIRLQTQALIADGGALDARDPTAVQHAAHELPPEVLRYLMPSRYCEVDLLAPIALDLFGNTEPGWPRVEAICKWVHERVSFSYATARPTRGALDVFTERVGVCRDFQHLAITFCRCLNIPARYAAGYLGDIGVPAAPYPMDFSAWFEVYLGGRWWSCDARHNARRIGRVLMATGLDATDAAITTTFGAATLTHFEVTSDAVPDSLAVSA